MWARSGAHNSLTPMHGEVLAVNGIANKEIVHVNLATGVSSQPIPLPILPVRVLVLPTGQEAYAFGLTSEVVPVDLVAGRAEAPVRLPGRVDDAVLSPGGRWLYVTTGSHTFSVVGTATGRLVAKLDLPGGAGGIVLSPDGTQAYVDAGALMVQKTPGLFAGSDDITQVNLATRTIGHVFKLPDTASVLGISPNGRTLYAAELPNSGSGPATVLYRVNLADETLGPGTPMNFSLTDFVMSPSGRTAYITTDTRHLAPLNLSTLAVGSSIAVGQDPTQAVFSSDGRYMAVGAFPGIVVVDLADARPYPPIPVDYGGSGFMGKALHGAIGLALLPQT